MPEQVQAMRASRLARTALCGGIVTAALGAACTYDSVAEYPGGVWPNVSANPRDAATHDATYDASPAETGAVLDAGVDTAIDAQVPPKDASGG